MPLVPLLLELGALLPDVEAPGPQSFIAVCDPPLELARGLVDEPLRLEFEPEVEPVVVLLPELVEPGCDARSGLAAKSPNTGECTTSAGPKRKRAASKCGPSSGRKSPKDLQCAPEDRPRTAQPE